MKNITPKKSPRSGLAAFTLVEVMITLGIATMFVMGLIIFTTITFQQGIFAIGNYTDLNSKSRRTLDILSRDIRSSSQLLNGANYYIRLTNNAGDETYYIWDGWNQFTRYKRNPSSGIYNWQVTVLMTNCDYLSFNTYSRVPTNNFEFYPVELGLPEAKLIDVRWRCSRSYLGAKLNTESVQTARIVMRN